MHISPPKVRWSITSITRVNTSGFLQGGDAVWERRSVYDQFCTSIDYRRVHVLLRCGELRVQFEVCFSKVPIKITQLNPSHALDELFEL